MGVGVWLVYSGCIVGVGCLGCGCYCRAGLFGVLDMVYAGQSVLVGVWLVISLRCMSGNQRLVGGETPSQSARTSF